MESVPPSPVPGRNAPCPCGSRKKFKRCHGAIPEPNRLVGRLLDHESKLQVFFTRDMMLNQLRRDCPKIAESFDRLWGSELEKISGLMSRTLMQLYAGRRVAVAQEDNLRLACGQLLLNATLTYQAAVAALRDGFRLQPGILIRNLLEAVSTVLHIFTKPADLPRYLAGTLPSPSTISTAKKVLPPYGRAYGFFSENYAHIGEPHRMDHPLVVYEDPEDPAVRFNLMNLTWTSWLLFVTSELVFLDFSARRYWRHVDENSYAYDPSPEERRWLARFLGQPEPKTDHHEA